MAMVSCVPGFLWPLLVYALVLGLHLIVPARWTEGYVRDAVTGAPLRYRLNGLRVLLVVMALWAAACAGGVLPWDLFYVQRWSMAAGACALGLVFTLAVVLPAPRVSASLAADLYLGRLPNPQWLGGRVDAKMLLYLIGAVMLELNVASFTARHLALHAADPSPGVLLYAGLFTFFVAEYLNFERVHLYTYDLFAERVGFKLGWGCLVFYPFFYCVGLWSVAERPDPHTPRPLLVASGLLFFCGWALSRGANLQKFSFKLDPGRRFLGWHRPRGDHRRRQAAPRQRVLGALPPRQLPRRDPHGPRPHALPRLPGRPLALALPGVLPRPPAPSPAQRRSALRREVRASVGGVLPQGALPDHPLGILSP